MVCWADDSDDGGVLLDNRCSPIFTERGFRNAAGPANSDARLQVHVSKEKHYATETRGKTQPNRPDVR
jgi:hypothetical protein